MTDFIPKYTPEQEALYKKAQASIEKMQEQVAKARNEWTDRIMQAILPDALYNMAKSNSMPQRRKVARWMTKNKVRFAEWPDRTEIKRHGEILGRFFVTMKNGKLEVEASIKKGLVPNGYRCWQISAAGLTNDQNKPQSQESVQENSGPVPPIQSPDASPDKGGAS